MANGDVPVTGSAVGDNDMFTITVANAQPCDNIKVRTTKGKKLMISVVTGAGGETINREMEKGSWRMEIFEV